MYIRAIKANEKAVKSNVIEIWNFYDVISQLHSSGSQAFNEI